MRPGQVARSAPPAASTPSRWIPASLSHFCSPFIVPHAPRMRLRGRPKGPRELDALTRCQANTLSDVSFWISIAINSSIHIV